MLAAIPWPAHLAITAVILGTAASCLGLFERWAKALDWVLGSGPAWYLEQLLTARAWVARMVRRG